MLVSRKSGQAFYQTHQRYPAGLDPPQKVCYQPPVLLIQRKYPAPLLMSYLYMETVQFKLLMDSLGEIYQLHNWKELNLRRQPLSLNLSTEWKTYHQLLQLKDDISMQLKELLINDMLIALFPNLHKWATICLSIPIFTASAERSFSDMKLINI